MDGTVDVAPESPSGSAGEGEESRWDDVPAGLRPPRRYSKWPFIVAAILLLFGATMAVAWPINLPYYALSPGPVYDVDDFVKVPDALDPNPTGEMYFLTVSLKEVNLFEYLGGLIDKRVELAPRENIRPAGVTPEELRQQNLDLMDNAKQNAIYVALTRLGYDVTFAGSGALISSVIDGSAADGLVEEGDIIVAVDGEPVEFSTDAVDLISGYGPGDQVTLTINRPTDETAAEFDTFDVVLTLGPFRFVDDQGNVEEDPNRGMVGVLLTNASVTINFPVEVDIDSQNIGGPSAGMMFTLQIMDLLTEQNLTHGNRIAGTGTIDQDGNVGAIGGIQQKTYAAIDAGAQYLLVPAGNYDDAVAAAGDDIGVVRIETIDDALAFLDTL